MSLIPAVSNPVNTVVPTYTMEESNRALGKGSTKTANGWYKDDKGKISVPKEKQWKLATGLHQPTHMEREALWDFTKSSFDGIGLRALLQKARKS